MYKYVLTAALFAAPLCAAAYDYDALPKTKPAPEREISYEEAFPNLVGKSYTEIEDLETKVARLERQAAYKRQQAQKEAEKTAQNKAEETQVQEENATSSKVTYTAIEDIDRKWDAAKKTDQKPDQKPAGPTREIWSADPKTGAHDWVAAPATEEKDAQAEQSTDEFPQK